MATSVIFRRWEAGLPKRYQHKFLMLAYCFSWRLASSVRFSIAVGIAGALHVTDSPAHVAGIESGFPPPLDCDPGIRVTQSFTLT